MSVVSSISKRTEISRLKKDGTLWIGSVVKIIFAPTSGSHHRLAVLVSRRHGIAAHRNYLKRIVRESVRILMAPVPEKTEALVFPKIREKKVHFSEVCRDIAQWKCSLKKPC